MVEGIGYGVADCGKELYWTAKCGRDFRTPLNEYENLIGTTCNGDCGINYEIINT